MANYYVIADLAGPSNAGPHSNEWPKIIAASVEAQTILLAEGSGHGLMGCNIPINDFDENDWMKLFKSANSEWFLIFLRNTKAPLEKHSLEQEILKHHPIQVRKF